MFLKAKNSAEERQGASDSRTLGISLGKKHHEMHSEKLKYWGRAYIETGRGLQ